MSAGMTTSIRHDSAAHRYEILVDGALAGYVDYRDTGTEVVFPHTVTLPEFRRRGLAAQLVRHALDDVRPSGKSVDPQCWFVAKFIDAHPEYADLRV